MTFTVKAKQLKLREIIIFAVKVHKGEKHFGGVSGCQLLNPLRHRAEGK